HVLLEHGNRPLDTGVTMNFCPGCPVASRGVAVLTLCPSCGSQFLQPLRCEAKSADVVMVELRCSDCMTWLKAPHTRADMKELDRRQAGAQAGMRARDTPA